VAADSADGLSGRYGGRKGAALTIFFTIPTSRHPKGMEDNGIHHSEGAACFRQLYSISGNDAAVIRRTLRLLTLDVPVFEKSRSAVEGTESESLRNTAANEGNRSASSIVRRLGRNLMTNT